MIGEAMIRASYRAAKRLAILLIGGTVTLLGLALLVLPGPAVVVLPIGLAILGVEFAWARHWLRRFRDGADQVFSRRYRR